MNQATIHFVGTAAEVGHHAAPLLGSGLADRYRMLVNEPDAVRRSARPGDLAVFYSEHFDRFRDLCSDVKQRQVATLYMIDGILEWRNAWENRAEEPACPFTMRPVLADKVACIGPAQARVVASWGNAEKVELTGIPRLDGLTRCQREPADDRFRLLIATAKCPGFTDEQVATTTRSLQDLRLWLEAHPTVQGREIVPTWRLTGDLADRVGVESCCHDLSGRELATVLGEVDAVISTPSTAILESMVRGRPTAVLDYHGTPAYLETAWSIRSSDQLEKGIEGLAAPDPARLHFQEFALRDQLLVGGVATDRMMRLMVGMLQQAARQIESGATALFFPAQMLGPADPCRLEWDQASIFPAYPEFREAERTELQAQLAHARREIGHLHRELEQARRELGQAHEIFEQIQNHPIAGRVIRVRESWLNWWSRWQRQTTSSAATPAAPANPEGVGKP